MRKPGAQAGFLGGTDGRRSQFRDVKKAFGTTHVIHGVDITIDDGEFVVLGRGLLDAASPPCCG